MRLPTPFLMACMVASLAVQGCNAECDNPERLDGHYSVWSNVVNHEPEEVPEGYPVKDLFYNGWSEWTLKYVPAQEAFDLILDGQRYTATYTSSEETCNGFGMDFKGTYTTPGGTLNDFQWKGDLLYYGSHIGGTWTYSSTWENPDTLDTGEVSTRGELTGAIISGAYDTGFGD